MKMLSRLRTIDRRLVTILLIVFVQMLGASMVLPILPRFAEKEFALTSRSIGVLVSSFFAAQFLAGPWIGRLSDKFGRVPVLIVSQLGTAISFVMLGVAWAPWVLFAARTFDGITGGNIIVAQAYITDITPRQKRTEALGYILATFGLGFIIGPAVGGILSAAFGARMPFLLGAGAAFLVTLLSWRTLDETLTPEQRLANRQFRQASLNPNQVLSNSPLLLVLLIGFVGQFGLGVLQATFALFGEAVLFAGSSEQVISIGIGLLLSIVGIFQFLTQAFLLRPLLRRFGEVALVLLGTGLRTIGFVLWALVPTPLAAGFASMFFAVGMSLMMPPLQSVSTKMVADQLRGGVLGIFQSAVSLSTIISTAAGGWLFGIDPFAPYWIALFISVFSILPILPLYRLAPPVQATDTVLGTPGD